LQGSSGNLIFSNGFESTQLPPAANLLIQEQNYLSADNMSGTDQKRGFKLYKSKSCPSLTASCQAT
jgi:hypothetical protein